MLSQVRNAKIPKGEVQRRASDDHKPNPKLLLLFRASFFLTMCWITLLTYGFVLMLSDSVGQGYKKTGMAAAMVGERGVDASSIAPDAPTSNTQAVTPLPSSGYVTPQEVVSPIQLAERAFNGDKNALAMLSVGVGTIFAALFGFITVGLWVLIES